ncbi:MAG: hypothetical protein ACREO8_03920, partial [Luteimonas sp.]
MTIEICHFGIHVHSLRRLRMRVRLSRQPQFPCAIAQASNHIESQQEAARQDIAQRTHSIHRRLGATATKWRSMGHGGNATAGITPYRPSSWRPPFWPART